ncbi:MAG: putative aliphatic sulfonates transport permease protein SsuC [Syntrophorhabdaceae bacterium PtaU1.Bin034]|nr:MAG: putative aliphatic sulfonates transport permease protein SsuC [Syntrophorhabdaceae bacterium PtaU1.Bin034]
MSVRQITDKRVLFDENIKPVATTEANKRSAKGPHISAALLRLHDRLLDWYGLIIIVLVWELGPRLGWIDMQFFPPPSQIIDEGVKLSVLGELHQHILASLGRTFAGFAVAAAAGVPLGFILGGYFPRLTHFLRPLLRLFGQMNAFSLFPIFVLFFGIGELAKFSVIFWSCLWPILFTTIAGVQGVDPLFVKVARSMGSGRLAVFARVLFPGALPSIFTGIRLGMTFAFLMLIAAEMVGAHTGLGWLVHNSQMNYVIPRLYLAAAVIAVLGMAMNYFLHALERRVVSWQEAVEVK